MCTYRFVYELSPTPLIFEGAKISGNKSMSNHLFIYIDLQKINWYLYLKTAMCRIPDNIFYLTNVIYFVFIRYLQNDKKGNNVNTSLFH